MTLPHQCRCVTCGEIGTIVPGLPNVFAQPPTIQPIEPDQSASAQSFREAVSALSGDAAYASSRADELAPREPTVQRTDLCVHGYTRCNVCKFPPPNWMIT